GAGALLAGGGLLTQHVSVQRTRALGREMIGLGAGRPLVDDDVDDLRDDVSGTLHDHRVADADVAAIAQRFVLAADTLDIILVVQSHVLPDAAAGADRLDLAAGRERAGAADLNIDALEQGDRTPGREFVRARPARRTRHEAGAFLPVEPIDLIDD